MRILVRLVLWIWFLAAFAAGQLVWLTRLPALAVQGLMAGLTVFLLAACFGLRPLRAWIDELDVRGLVLLHVTRFVAIYSLLLYRRGFLPYAFAVPCSWSDIFVAAFALAVVWLPVRPETRRHLIFIWNTVGLTGLALALLTVLRILLAQPWQLVALQHLPLSLLPTFLVPLLLTTHIIIYVRLRRPAPETSPAG